MSSRMDFLTGHPDVLKRARAVADHLGPGRESRAKARRRAGVDQRARHRGRVTQPKRTGHESGVSGGD